MSKGKTKNITQQYNNKVSRKIISLSDNALNQPSKFMTKNCVQINNNSHGICNTNRELKSKNSMVKSSLGGYSDAYILAIGIITKWNYPKHSTHSAKLRPEGVLRTFPENVLWTFPYGTLCNAKGRPLPTS